MNKSNFNKKMIISVAGAALLSIGFAGLNGQDGAINATTVSAKTAKSKVVGVNSAVYKKIGKKIVKTSAVIKAGNKVTINGKKTIKGVTYYEVGKGQYIKAANVNGKNHKLAKSTSLYTRSGKAIKGSKMAKGKMVRTFGKAITINGKKFYATKHGYVPAKALAVKQAPVDDITPTNPATPTAPTTPTDNTNTQKPSNTTNVINGGNVSNGTNNGSSNNINPPANGSNDVATTRAESYKDIDNAVIDAHNEFANAALPLNTDKEFNTVQQIANDAEKALDDAKTSSEMVSIKENALTKIKDIVNDFMQRTEQINAYLTLVNNGVLTISSTTIDNPATIVSALKDANIDPDFVKEIHIDGQLTLTGKADELFSGLHNLTQITGLDKVDTSGVTSMKSMFSDCQSLTTLDLSKFDTTKVTDMSQMFAGDKFDELNLGGFSVSESASVSDAFKDASVAKLTVSNKAKKLLQDTGLDLSKLGINLENGLSDAATTYPQPSSEN